MDQQTLINSFIENLSELDDHLDKLSKLLLAEETALAEQNLSGIETIATEKNQLTAQVEHAEQLRQSLCAKLQIAPDKQGIQQWLKTKSIRIQQQVSALWKRITYLGQKCSTQNQINGILVAHQQRHTQDALSILRGAVTGQESYSETGAQENKQNQQIIAKA
jgi:flagellar biosynthesis/type III secretory pathway chaperone